MSVCLLSPIVSLNQLAVGYPLSKRQVAQQMFTDAAEGRKVTFWYQGKDSVN